MKHDTDLGTLSLQQYVNAKRTAKQEELKKYEKQFLSRYNVPKARLKSKGWAESDVDLGTLNLSQYVNAKRTAKQEELKKYEKQFLSRYKQPKAKPIKSSNLKSAADVGKLTLRQYVNAKRNAKQEEIKKYEQQYLARYKQPKSGVMKPKSWTESDVDLGKLTLRQYVNAKRNAKQEEIKKYEQQYLARYKQPKSGVMKPKSWTESDVDLGKLTLRQYVNAKRRAKQEELKKYEKQFLSRYKQPKAKPIKSSNLKSAADVGKLTLQQYVNAKRNAKQEEIKKYEQQYLARYKQPKSGVMKPKSWTESDVDLGKLTLRQYVNAKA